MSLVVDLRLERKVIFFSCNGRDLGGCISIRPIQKKFNKDNPSTKKEGDDKPTLRDRYKGKWVRAEEELKAKDERKAARKGTTG